MNKLVQGFAVLLLFQFIGEIIASLVDIPIPGNVTGVSTAAVSRVLNDYPDIRSETKQKVLEAMKKLSYKPSALARGLAKNKANSIGVVIPHSSDFIFSDVYFMELLRGIGEIATEARYHLLIITPRS